MALQWRPFVNEQNSKTNGSDPRIESNKKETLDQSAANLDFDR